MLYIRYPSAGRWFALCQHALTDQRNIVDHASFKQLQAAAFAASERVSTHPFLLRAAAGQLSADEIRRWICLAGRESRLFPRILEEMLRQLDTPEARAILGESWAIVHQVLAENLDDENGNGDPEEAHFHHYLQLLPDAGLTLTDFESYIERGGIAYALALAAAVSSQSDIALALAYMWLNELLTGPIYGAMNRARHRWFPDMKEKFFVVHVEVDIEHTQALEKAIAALPSKLLPSLRYGLELAEAGMSALLWEAGGLYG